MASWVDSPGLSIRRYGDRTNPIAIWVVLRSASLARCRDRTKPMAIWVDRPAAKRLPRRGETNPMALWGRARLRVPPDRVAAERTQWGSGKAATGEQDFRPAPTSPRPEPERIGRGSDPLAGCAGSHFPIPAFGYNPSARSATAPRRADTKTGQGRPGLAGKDSPLHAQSPDIAVDLRRVGVVPAGGPGLRRHAADGRLARPAALLR